MVKKILMCRPTYFGVDYSINPWMDDNIGKANTELAIYQWEQLYNAIKKVIDVELVEPVEGLPDMVFTANAGFYDQKTGYVLLSRFRNNQRSGEEQHFFKWFSDHNYPVFQGTNVFEGEGDLLRAETRHWIGYGFRSQQQTADSRPFDQLGSIEKLRLVDSRFYHLDTCFAPLSGTNSVLWYPDAFSSRSQSVIRSLTDPKQSIEATEAEAVTFCCNAVVVGRKVFMPNCNSIADKLAELGYEPMQFDMSEFIKAGGACKCLTMWI